MEISIKIAWAMLVVLHLVPALTGFMPTLLEETYGVAPKGDVGILLSHRGILFLTLCITALYAMFEPGSRKLASVVLTVSMIGFLLIYWRAGMPEGELQKIAIADALHLIPLFWVSVQAWR